MADEFLTKPAIGDSNRLYSRFMMYFKFSWLVFVLWYLLFYFTRSFGNSSALMSFMLCIIPYLPAVAWSFTRLYKTAGLNYGGACVSAFLLMVAAFFVNLFLEINVYYAFHGNRGEFDGIQFFSFNAIDAIVVFILLIGIMGLIYRSHRRNHPELYANTR